MNVIRRDVSAAMPAWRWEAIAAAIVAMLVAVTVTAVVQRASIFEDYSVRFGALSTAEFESLNAEMDAWERVARIGGLALVPADIALLGLSLRAWCKRGGLFAKLAFFAGLIVALCFAFVLFVASAIPRGPGMLG